MAIRIVLLSTYDMGRQPFGLANAAAWLEKRGHHVTCADLAVQPLPLAAVADAHLVAFYLPMHTATRLAVPWIQRVRTINPKARLAAYGLYASLNAEFLASLGVRWIARTPLDRKDDVVPNRSGLKPLDHYARLLVDGGERIAGYTEASRGCKHLCRHCPVVPVYRGTFRIFSVETTLADIRQQWAAGARHITFGDPDFFNGPGHARRIVQQLHREFPDLTYDVTVKIQHLLQHRDLLPLLRETGCLFVTSAVESLDDDVLRELDKGHTRADFFQVVTLMREHRLTLAPTFIAFTPWTTRESYREFLNTIRDLNLVENVASVQLALRLLITSASRLLELADIQRVCQSFDPPSLLWRWKHEDAEMDALAGRVIHLVAEEQKRGSSRSKIFCSVWAEAYQEPLDLLPRATIPYLNEPWYC